MKVYKTTWSGPDGCYVHWSGSKHMAEYEVKRLAREAPELDHMATVVEDVPQLRKALIGWLNKNHNMENG